MIILLTPHRRLVTVQARAAGPNIEGDAIEVVREGECFGELRHTTLAAAGAGAHDYDELLKRQLDNDRQG